MNVLILFTNCQAAWSGVAISYFLLVYSHLTNIKRLATLIGAFLVILSFLITNNLSPNQFQRHTTESDIDLYQHSWLHTIQGIMERPLTGWGSHYIYRKG